MGTKIITKGVDASLSASEILFPFDVPPAYFATYGLGVLRRNLASGGSVPLVGAPQSYEGFGLFSGNDYLDSGVFEPSQFTLMAAAFQPSYDGGQKNSLVISTNLANSKSGSSLFLDSDGVHAAVTTLNGQAEVIVQAPVLPVYQDHWALVSARFDGTNLVLDDLTNNHTSTAAIQYGRSLTGATYRIGGGYGGGGLPVGIASATIFPRRITDVELKAMAALMRAEAALNNINV